MQHRLRFGIVGFDLDGTLLDTAGDIAGSVNHALAADGRALLSRDTVAGMVGGGVRQLIRRAVAATGGGGETDVDRLLAWQQPYYAEHLLDTTRPFPGAIEALDELRGMGVKLAVVTNKRAANTADLLERLGIADRFGCVVGGDTLPRAKPHRDPIDHMVAALGGGAAVFVGDSRFDVEAAHASGIPAVACRFGYRDEPVEAIGADAIIDGFDQLLPALARL